MEIAENFGKETDRCVHSLASSTATITCLVFNEPARHFVRHHLAQRLQHRFFTLQHVMYIRIIQIHRQMTCTYSSTKYHVLYSMKSWPYTKSVQGAGGKTVKRFWRGFSQSLINKSNFLCICWSFPAEMSSNCYLVSDAAANQIVGWSGRQFQAC